MKLPFTVLSSFLSRRSLPIVRSALTAAALVLLSGIFSSQGFGCGLPTYRCGGKNSANDCGSHLVQGVCEQAAACQWRVGCASTCRDAKTIEECAPNCTVSGGNCFGAPCTTSTGAQITSQDQCPVGTECAWESACWDAPNTECTGDLNETQCTQRNCVWEKENGQL